MSAYITPGGRAIMVTFFTDHAAATKREETLTLEALATRIHSTTADAKENLPWLKLARFGPQRTKHGSLRHNANVLAISGIEGDYDRKEMSLAEAKDIIGRSGIAALIYPSPSYTPDEPKWRVLCPLSTEYPPAERDRFMARLNGLFGGIFSRESWVLPQSYYFGRVHNVDHHATVFQGTCIDQRNDLDANAIKQLKERNIGQQARPKSRPEDITEARHLRARPTTARSYPRCRGRREALHTAQHLPDAGRLPAPHRLVEGGGRRAVGRRTALRRRLGQGARDRVLGHRARHGKAAGVRRPD